VQVVRRGAVLGGLVVVLAGVAAWAAPTPQTGTALAPRIAVAAAPPSFLRGLGRTLLTLQGTLNQGIGRHLRAIRDGHSPGALAVGLAFAFLYGVLHALGPGHGKVVVVSYFLSRTARLGRGLRMGVQVAATHTLSAVAVFWLADLSLQTVLGGASGAIRGVQAVSCGATAGVGALLLVRAVRRALGRQELPGTEGPHGPASPHLSLVSVCVGLVPCTGAVLILLFALANDMLVIGTIMVVAIATGMAVTMSALGVLGILTRGALVSRWGGRGYPHSAALALEVGGALAILLLSAVLFLGSLWA
jgi:ABC-type nickel/cobalt efflux system permease component RcnA